MLRCLVYYALCLLLASALLVLYVLPHAPDERLHGLAEASTTLKLRSAATAVTVRDMYVPPKSALDG